ncbi:MAG TPA: WYL domain-containing protein [Candidatus Limnocylindrales bacterium]|nr:WYL domain-containing protein [Candidatus Limnocylindrales bacterium]
MTPPLAGGGVQPYSKAERLLNLLMALRGTRTGLDREHIRAVVRGYSADASPEAFERMFERDKDELRAMGVPVVTMTDASGVVTGYRIEGDWALPPLELTRGELALLGLAARVWQRADLAPAALNALRKVEAQLGMRSAPQGSAPIAGLSLDSPALHVLIEACSARTAVTFEYRKAPGSAAELRHVQPWGTVWWRAHWYVVGLDTDRGEVRVFRASRIEGPVRTDPAGLPYEVPAGFDAADAIGRFARSDVTIVDLALAPGVAAELRLRAEPRGRAADGADLVALPVEDLASGIASVLAYGSGARVLGPPAAVAEAVAQLDSLRAALASPAPKAGRVLTSGAQPGGPGTAQFARLLALVPWLAANSGVRVADAAAHFGITEDQLMADLGSVITSGADDWTLFDIQYWEDGGGIEVIDALDLDAPLTLTPDEGFALMVALNALAAVPGGADSDELASVTVKLAAALGRHAPAPGVLAVRVDLPEDVVGPVERALASGRALELTYLGAVRDEVTHRVVDPLGVVVVDGYGYVRGYCRSAGGLRMFRVDRIRAIRVSDLPARTIEAPDEVEPMSVALGSTGRSVLVDVPPGSPLLDRHPVTRRWALPEGDVRAELPVGDFAWARRLVLGSAGTIVLREPEWLVAELVATVEASRRLYRPEMGADGASE